ncbi:hypothetical protein [Bordetella bronchiseptica]|uniref:hypothetical protein n=1 Tax=Bordetella bronchiseptica TaxID=518 RepID=UPI001244AB05|nr:hypothetical protein [Bordetella bronchiseptica]KAB1448549.1 hypothetical protein F7D00_08435 [Bordetella bronchiseptica]KAB1574871.1 hypothetical protein F7890_08435 [Bordetella bronchiseptica]
MSASTFFISETVLRHFKQHAQRKLTGVSSSHLSEAIAAALGFKTHAALRAALAGGATVEAKKPSNARFVQRLQELDGYIVPDDLMLLPELQHSYTPFKSWPLKTKHGVRWWAWRNLMVAAINAGLEQHLFGLSPGENWWPGASPDCNQCARGNYHFVFDTDLLAVVSVNAISGDELSISVILKPKHANIEPEWYCGLASGEAVAHGWLERRLGAWIQDASDRFSCKRILQPRLAEVAIDPAGYSDQGSFIM